MKIDLWSFGNEIMYWTMKRCVGVCVLMCVDIFCAERCMCSDIAITGIWVYSLNEECKCTQECCLIYLLLLITGWVLGPISQ